MKTIHPEPKLVFVFDDGDGNHFLRVQSLDGDVQMLPLSLDRSLKLIADLTAAARSMAKSTQKRAE
jgi:hypothetical protein